MSKKGRVAVGLSGGVDSSVAAALLLEQGYDVFGVYALGWTGDEQFPCHWQEEEASARAVAEQLGIPFYTINLTKEYEAAVIKNFFEQYQAGVTPNPDILCNSEIKFKALWQALRQFEPDFIATGHYAQITNAGTAEAQILKGADPNKDQSYFLWGISKVMLPNILFPVGHLLKSEVRELAKKYQLPTATKKDSQGVCFIGPLKVRQFIRSHVAMQPGLAVLKDGRTIAEHDGLPLYTIGQRLGAGTVAWTGDVPPLYVIAKDTAKNQLIVGSDGDCLAQTLVAATPNWLTKLAGAEFSALVKVRYRQADCVATVRVTGEQLAVQFEEPVRAITAGQSVVFYGNDGLLLGGAIIARIPAQDALLSKSNEGAKSAVKV